jgi:hypothetical protein
VVGRASVKHSGEMWGRLPTCPKMKRRMSKSKTRKRSKRKSRSKIRMTFFSFS